MLKKRTRPIGFKIGAGRHPFSGELQRMGTQELLEFTRMTGAVVNALRECPLPVIAAINGVAAGAGSVVALASDFRLLARSANFPFLFTKVGLAGADMGSAYLLPRLVGLGRATELLILGDTVDSARAEAIGLANQALKTRSCPPLRRHAPGGSPTGPRSRTRPPRCCSPESRTWTWAVRSNSKR